MKAQVTPDCRFGMCAGCGICPDRGVKLDLRGANPVICRVKFGENAAGKFLSHLDMLRAWQRAISRSGLPLSYSNGFNKHPKLAFSAALSVGFTERS